MSPSPRSLLTLIARLETQLQTAHESIRRGVAPALPIVQARLIATALRQLIEGPDDFAPVPELEMDPTTGRWPEETTVPIVPCRVCHGLPCHCLKEEGSDG
jgi:hypothetical protein